VDAWELALHAIPSNFFKHAVKGNFLAVVVFAALIGITLPRLLENIVAFGVPRRDASFVIPIGYSFNLDGSTLYLVLASLTIAQAAGVELGLWPQITMVFTLMLASKGMASVPACRARRRMMPPRLSWRGLFP
jgi:Na+/H+-dicarboxylate symporter